MTIETAISSLINYGYAQEGDRFFRPNKTQQWVVQGDHFARFDDGAQTPHHALSNEFGLNYTDPAQHDSFEWAWSADEVERIYTAGLAGRTAEPSPPEE